MKSLIQVGIYRTLICIIFITIYLNKYKHILLRKHNYNLFQQN